ncbi:MAG: hypothetical protein ACP5I3_12610 [Thermoproteus sp.]
MLEAKPNTQIWNVASYMVKRHGWVRLYTQNYLLNEISKPDNLDVHVPLAFSLV